MSSQCKELAMYDSRVINLYTLDGINRESDRIW